MSKLLPCPFCEDEIESDNDGNTQWYICSSCGYEISFVNGDFWNHRPGEEAARTEMLIAGNKAEYERGLQEAHTIFTDLDDIAAGVIAIDKLLEAK